jgi:Cu/Ag efflux protein CusF
MNFPRLIAISLLVTSGLAQAQKPQDGMTMLSPANQSTSQSFGVLTDAVVQRIDTARGEIVLKHGDIPNLGMPAMTMAFDANGKMLRKVKAGDNVRFHAEITGGRPALTHIEQADVGTNK